MGFADKYIVPTIPTKDWNAIVGNYQKQQVEAEGEWLQKELELDTLDQAIKNLEHDIQNYHSDGTSSEYDYTKEAYYKDYDKYRKDLLNLRDIVDKYGVQSLDRKWVYQLNRDYANKISPIINAAKNKDQKVQKYMEDEKAGKHWLSTPKNVSLADFINDPYLEFATVNMKDYKNDLETAFSELSDQLYKTPSLQMLAETLPAIVSQYGANSKDILNFINNIDVRGTMYDMFRNAISNVNNQYGITASDYDQDTMLQGAVNSALYKALGQRTHTSIPQSTAGSLKYPTGLKYDTIPLVEVGGAEKYSYLKSLMEDPNKFNDAFASMYTEELNNAKKIKGYDSIKDEKDKEYVDNAYNILGEESKISKDELALFFYGVGLDNDRRSHIGNAIRTYNKQADASDKWWKYNDNKPLIQYPISGIPKEHYSKAIENSEAAKLLESLGISIKDYDNAVDLYNAVNVAFNDPSVGNNMGFGTFEAPQYSLSGEARNNFISYINGNSSENVVEWNAKGKDKDTGQTIDMTTIDTKNIGNPYFIPSTGQVYVNVTVDGKQKTINITNKMPNSVKSRISKASQDIEYIESAEQILEYAIATGNKDLIDRASKNLEVAKNNYTGGINELFTNLGYTIGSKNLLTGN